MSIYQSHSFRNPKRLSFLAFILFVLVLGAYLIQGILSLETSFFTSFVNSWQLLLPAMALVLTFLHNHWFGDLMLLDQNGRAAYRFVFPSFFLIISLGIFSDIRVQTLTSHFAYPPILTFIACPLLALFFIYLILSTKDKDNSPNVMLILGFLLSALVIFYSSKLLSFLLLVPVLLYRLNSISWRNKFAFILGFVLLPLFVLPYLYYLNGIDCLQDIEGWTNYLVSLPTWANKDYIFLLTMILLALFGQANYSFKTGQLSTKQRSFLSSFSLTMWFSLLYLCLLNPYDVFAISLFLFTASLLLSRGLVVLKKRAYYLTLVAYVLIIFTNLYIIT